MAIHNEIGALGEGLAVQFLKKKGLTIVERNYLKPYGEIDIVARENGIIRFVEVKTVSYLPADRQVQQNGTLSRETIRPEENMHPHKIKRLSRVVQAYLFSHETGEWAFDLICVYVDQKTRSARVKWVKDIVLE